MASSRRLYRIVLFVFLVGTVALAAAGIAHYLSMGSFSGLVVSGIRLTVLCLCVWAMHHARGDSSVDKSAAIDVGIIGVLAVYVFCQMGSPLGR